MAIPVGIQVKLRPSKAHHIRSTHHPVAAARQKSILEILPVRERTAGLRRRARLERHLHGPLPLDHRGVKHVNHWGKPAICSAAAGGERAEGAGRGALRGARQLRQPGGGAGPLPCGAGEPVEAPEHQGNLLRRDHLLRRGLITLLSNRRTIVTVDLPLDALLLAVQKFDQPSFIRRQLGCLDADGRAEPLCLHHHFRTLPLHAMGLVQIGVHAGFHFVVERQLLLIPLLQLCESLGRNLNTWSTMEPGQPGLPILRHPVPVHAMQGLPALLHRQRAGISPLLIPGIARPAPLLESVLTPRLWHAVAAQATASLLTTLHLHQRRRLRSVRRRHANVALVPAGHG
mmetsp:Transcript_25196/g.64482  ORF Transcript_25196/g.64482 Transcript_25196/m.64482 type:complete len:344 (+) Transcript_25196:1055-2086(+)